LPHHFPQAKIGINDMECQLCPHGAFDNRPLIAQEFFYAISATGAHGGEVHTLSLPTIITGI